MKCTMCGEEFRDGVLDFLGRCEMCFREYLDMSATDRPNLGVPFTPISKAVK